jgi:transposase-like protein
VIGWPDAPPSLFGWRFIQVAAFEPEVILLAVGWYLRFSLSYRDVEELLAERGLLVDHVTVWRWVPRMCMCCASGWAPARVSTSPRRTQAAAARALIPRIRGCS